MYDRVFLLVLRIRIFSSQSKILNVWIWKELNILKYPQKLFFFIFMKKKKNKSNFMLIFYDILKKILVKFV